MRLAPILFAALAVPACAELAQNGHRDGSGSSGVTAPVVPLPMTFSPDDARAAVFEDDDLNLDVIQVYAFENSFGSGVFLQFPAAYAAQAGSHVLDPAADPAVQGWFATADEQDDDDDLRWDYALHSAGLVVLTAATSEGMTIALTVTAGAFVFENCDGVQNPAVTALVSGFDPPLTAELEDDPILD